MKIHLNMKSLEWSEHFSHYKHMGIFPDAQGQPTPQSEIWYLRISNPSEILWSSLPARIKNQLKMKELDWSQDFPSITLRELSVAMKPKHGSNLAPNLMQPIPYPNNSPDEIWFWLTSWSQKYSCLKKWTHGWTPARVQSYKLTGSPRLTWAKNYVSKKYHVFHAPVKSGS